MFWISKNRIFRFLGVIAIMFNGASFYCQENISIEDLILQSEQVYDSNPDSSFALCCTAEEESIAIGYTEKNGDIAYCKGRYYLLMTQYGKSSEELKKAVLFYEEHDQFSNLSATYSLQSILLERIGDFESAHNTLLKAYKIDKETGNVDNQVHTLSNLILDFLVPNKLDSALYYLNTLDSLKENIEGPSIFYYHQNWGTYYYLNGEYQQALKFQQQALHLANLYDMLDSKATIHMFLAMSYLGNDQIDEARSSAQKSYEIANENSLIFEKSEALEQLVAIEELSQNYHLAFKLQKELSDIEAEIYALEKVRKVKEMEGQLLLSQKEKIIAEQELSIKEEKLHASNEKSKNLILYSIISIVSILVFFTLWIYLKSKSLNISIGKQKDIIEEKNEILEEAYQNIHDSLEYSKFIQRAMLPSAELFSKNLKDHFILFQPKEIVSGDFYWATEQNGSFYFSVVDCTGHGVPGAMVSIIGYNGLNRCLKELKLIEPAEILNNLTEFVEETLYNEEKEMKDGMDMALCSYNKNSKVLTYSGANNSIYVLSNGELNEYKANKQPVGKFPRRTAFTNHEIQLKEGDAVYLFSDGYADQFGGERGKKLKYKAFKHIITTNSDNPMEIQKTKLMDKFETWKGDLEQIDDVCILGFKI